MVLVDQRVRHVWLDSTFPSLVVDRVCQVFGVSHGCL